MLPWGPPWSDSLIFSNWEGPGGLRNDPNVPIEDRALRLVLPSIATLSLGISLETSGSNKSPAFLKFVEPASASSLLS